MKNIRPTGRKGKEVLDRMKSLMGNAPLQENHVKKSKLEIDKLGPDNKVYAIIRENQEYYIKTSDKIADLVLEDFNYIGGLKNKKDHAHKSYSQALKQLNLKMISLNEQFGGEKINVFESDNLTSAGGTYNFKGEEEEEEVNEVEFVEEDIVENFEGDETRDTSKDELPKRDKFSSMESDKDIKWEDKGKTEGELKVKAVQDGPKSLDGNTIGDFEDSKVEPDDAPNDKSTGTEKEGSETASPKKTIKEETRKPKFSILEAMEKMDSIFESAGKKKI